MSTADSAVAAPLAAETLLLRGRVQGVGFRPFVYRLAAELQLQGWVRNTTGQVEILVQGSAAQVQAFRQRVVHDAPPLAAPQLLECSPAAVQKLGAFHIQHSDAEGTPDIVVPPDHFMCDDCLSELHNPADRRYRYPFLNCTQCGPRWTIILDLPYDRPKTTLKDFPLCADCLAEYREPMDRRFHAEPIACPRCGPQLSYQVSGELAQLTGEQALSAALADLRAGRIVAVKGVGGYHLLCDAANEQAVQTLRTRKHRPGKPLAVMFPQRGSDQLEALREVLAPGPQEAAALRSPERPIVLVRTRGGRQLAPGVAPRLGEVGAFLPYSPLHQLLLSDFAAPLVATSGNISGEPVLTDPGEATRRLKGLADSFLHHDRPIVRPADDSVVRLIAGQVRPIRVGRGMAPLELPLPAQRAAGGSGVVLATGAHMKNTIAVGLGERAIVSPHIGEMDTLRSLAVFETLAADLPRLFQVRPERLVCDAHPSYATSRWARAQNLPLLEVFHHHAHASAIWAEARLGSGAVDSPRLAGVTDDMLVFTWDGVGYGEDGSLWGGEALWGRPGAWRRVGSIMPMRLPGGERAGRQPWRSAAAMAWAAGLDWQPDLPDAERKLVRHAFERGLNAPLSTAVGRIFDGAAALVLGLQCSSFEAEGPMQLEALAVSAPGSCGPCLPVIEDAQRELLAIDWRPLPGWLADASLPAAQRAMGLHHSLAHALVAMAGQLCSRYGKRQLGLAGGVFQNRVLSELVIEALQAGGFEVILPASLPCNDAAISYGQLLEAYASPNSAWKNMHE